MDKRLLHPDLTPNDCQYFPENIKTGDKPFRLDGHWFHEEELINETDEFFVDKVKEIYWTYPKLIALMNELGKEEATLMSKIRETRQRMDKIALDWWHSLTEDEREFEEDIRGGYTATIELIHRIYDENHKQKH